MTPETKLTINFGPIKGGLEFSGSTFSGRKLHLKIATPYMVHHGALRLKYAPNMVYYGAHGEIVSMAR